VAVDTKYYVWRIEQGQIETLNVPVTNDGDEFDVTGWDVDVKFKTNPGGTELYDFPSDGISIDDDVITLTLPAVESSEWDFFIGWYRVEITDPDSEDDDPTTYRVLHGAFLVDQN
jgi:hypothetical protein